MDLVFGFKEPCPYFDTKPENVPRNLIGAIQTAEEFKEHKLLQVNINLDKITAFEYECYRIATYASTTVEAEETAEAIKESKKGQNAGAEKIGGNPVVPNRVIDDPFKKWEE